MTNDLPQGPAEWDDMHPYASLTPDAVLDALADIGLMGDGRLIALSSYENRVYQIQLETERTPVQTNGTPVPDSVVAKFYRPGRWSDAQILEEHAFSHELMAAEHLKPGYGLSSGGAGRRRIGWGFGVDGGCREGGSGDCKHGEIAGI